MTTAKKTQARLITERNSMHLKRTAFAFAVLAVLLALSACNPSDLDPHPARTTPAVAPTAPRGGDHR